MVAGRNARLIPIGYSIADGDFCEDAEPKGQDVWNYDLLPLLLAAYSVEKFEPLQTITLHEQQFKGASDPRHAC
jgi:hypothetical protein